MFKLKGKFLHQDCKVYKRVCPCAESYIDETIRNIEVCWHEHNIPINKSNPSKHIKNNLDHDFTWLVLANAPKNMFQKRRMTLF